MVLDQNMDLQKKRSSYPIGTKWLTRTTTPQEAAPAGSEQIFRF
jgi:hypothetical protein